MEDKSKPRKDGKMLFNHPEFVRAWASVWKAGGHVEDVALVLGVNVRLVRGRAEYLRKKGVNLPSFKVNTKISDQLIQSLNDIVDEEI